MIVRRHILYCPGFDPDAHTRYQNLFRTGLRRHARRFGLKATLGPLEESAAPPLQAWQASLSGPGWQTETRVEILHWDDVLKQDFSRPWYQRLPAMARMAAAGIASGVLPRVARIFWPFACVLAYPWLALLGLLLAAVATVFLVHGVADLLDVPGWAGWLAGLAGAWALITALRGPYRRGYVWHLLDDWMFHWNHARGRQPGLDARLDQFADKLVALMRSGTADEVLVVGHSVGAVLAVEIASRALQKDPAMGRGRAQLGVVTLGSCMAVLGMIPAARRFREDLQRLMLNRFVRWVEFQSPQDVLNIFGFRPATHLRLELGGQEPANPVVLSARLREAFGAEALKKLRWNFFRLHFLFLSPNENPTLFDYVMLCHGPVALRERISLPEEETLRRCFGPRPN